jgi:hypothetical protein
MTSSWYRVLILSPGQDTAGIGARLREMLLTHVPGMDVVAVRSSETYLQFPRHLEWSWPQVHQLAERAQLIHIHNHVIIPDLLRYFVDRPLVIHHHGTIFRDEPAVMLAAADEYKAVTVVSTLDLTMFRKDIRWLPSPITVDWIASLRAKYYQPAEKIRIVHAPTNRAVKDTALFIETIAALKAKGLPVEGMVIEGMPWAECLKMKARHADIFYDQLQLGYGQNALEMWAMGVPVVAGAAPGYEKIFRARLGDLPYHRATPATLAARLEDLVRNEALRREEAARGHEYVRRWHDYPRVAEMTLDAYDEAARRKGQSLPARLPSPSWPSVQSAEAPQALPV